MKREEIVKKMSYKREPLRTKTVRGAKITSGGGRPYSRKEKTLQNIPHGTTQFDEYIKKHPGVHQKATGLDDAGYKKYFKR
jgi:hypothetical protein